MRRAVRAIIIKDDRVLVMHRNKFGQEYYTLPGGKIEIGESPEQALFRELMEETGVTFKSPRLMWLEHADLPYGDQYVFLCDYESGEPVLAADSEEAKINQLGQNIFTPMWVELTQLPNLTFRSEYVKQALLHALPDKWPEKPQEIFWH